MGRSKEESKNSGSSTSSMVTVAGISNPTMARREALVLASDLNLQRLKIATNCLEVANEVKVHGHCAG
jgi:hypothetical protein